MKIIEAALPYVHMQNKDNMMGVIATVDAAMEFINTHFVDQREYEEFMENIRYSKKYDVGIYDMLKNLDTYHKETLSECEKDPAWKKFDNGMDSVQ